MDVPEDVQRTLGRIDGKLDMLLRFHTETRETTAALDRRISILEKWRWMIAGGGAVIGAVVGVALHFI